MTDRNELERLLAAATEGPWRFDQDWARIPTIHAPNGVEIANVIKLGFPHRDNRTPAQEANAALIVWLRNNAPHYLSLMDEVERLRGGVESLRTCCACDKTFSGAGQGAFICNQCAGAD